MRYSTSIDARFLRQAELQARLADMETFANTTKISPEDVDPEAVEYRHLGLPPRFRLMSEPDWVTQGLPVSSGGIDWYPCNNHVLQHAATHANAPNVDGVSTKPVVLFRGCLSAVGFTPGAGLGQACVGVRASSGVPWVPLDGTSGRDSRRSFGIGNGLSMAFYDNRETQTHYLLGTSNYEPIDYPSDRCLELVVHFGGSGTGSYGNPVLLEEYTIMVSNILDDNRQVWAWAQLSARERGF